MSEETETGEKTVKVEISGQKEELERLQTLLSDLALKEASKYGLEPEDLESMSSEEIFAYCKGLEEKEKQKPKKQPAGIVRLKTRSKTTPLLEKEFESQKDMIETLGELARSGDSEARNILNELWLKKADLRGLQGLDVEFSEVPEGLPKNFTWWQYSEWLKNHSGKVK